MSVIWQIKMRADSAANWASANPVLALGELGYDYDNGIFKVGTGGTAWNSLSIQICMTLAEQTLTSKTLTSPKVAAYDGIYNGSAKVFEIGSWGTAVNWLGVEAAPTGNGATLFTTGSDTDVDLLLTTKGSGAVNVNAKLFILGSNGYLKILADTDASEYNIGSSATGTLSLYGEGGGSLHLNMFDGDLKTAGTVRLSNAGVLQNVSFSTGVAAADLPNGITNGNTSQQSQAVVSGTSYYIAGSNLNLPASLKAGMAVGTRFRWRVAMAKTAAGTGAFAIEIRRGTAGTTADTADVSQSVGTQTAVVDSMVVDVEMVVTATGASGSYFWSIIPVHQAATATGFGVATGPTGQFSGTVSGVAMNTASLKFGLSFKATTGTPTITVPLVQASAINIC